MEFQEQYQRALVKINIMYRENLAKLEAYRNNGADEKLVREYARKLEEVRDNALEELHGAML